jgi:tetratricopeptide (TPR) repeat protein
MGVLRSTALRRRVQPTAGNRPRCGVAARLLVLGTHTPSILELLWRGAWLGGRLRRWVVSGWRRPLLWVIAIGACLWVIDRWLSALSWFSFWSVLALAIISAFGFAIWRARVRMVVEPFLDYTGSEESGTEEPKVAPAVNTLLVAELAALRDLFVVNDDRTAVHTVAGEARPVETTLQLEDVSEFLSDSATSDSKLSFGPLVVPIGTVLAMLGRLARGPRLSGTVQIVGTRGPDDEARQLATLTAFYSSADGLRSWSVEQMLYDDAGPLFHGSAMRGMVKELATRIFADLALPNVRSWRASKCFLEGLDCYRLAGEGRRDRGLKLQQAERLFAEALGYDDQLPLARYNLGVVYSLMAEDARARDPEGASRHEIAAENAWRDELRHSDAKPEVYYQLASLYYMQGRFDDVPSLCDRAIELDRDAAGKAKAYDLKGLAERARDDEGSSLDRAVASRRRAVAYGWLALLRGELTASDSAGTREPASLGLFNLAIGLAYRMKAKSLDRRRLGRGFRQCKDLLGLAARLKDSSPPHFELAKIALEFGHPGVAVRELRAALRIDPFDGLCWVYLASAASDGYVDATKRRDAASAAAWQVETRRATRNACNFLSSGEIEGHAEQLATALEVIGDDQEAAAVRAFPIFLRELAADDSAAVAGGEQLGERVEQLETQLREETQLWYRGHIAMNLGLLYQRTANPQESLRCFDEAIRSFETDHPEEIRRSGLRGQRARELVKLQRWQNALSDALGATAEDPVNSWERQVLGDVYRDLEDLEHAVEAYQFALLSSPDNAGLHWQLGYCHWLLALEATDHERRAAAYRRAIEHFRAMLALSPDSEDVRWSHYWLGRAHTDIGDYRHALPHFRIAGALAESPTVVKMFTAQAYMRMKNYESAESTIAEALHDLSTKLDAPDGALTEVSLIGKDIGDEWSAGAVVAELHALLAQSLIRRDARIEDARTAIRAAGDMLDRLGTDENRFTRATIRQLEGLIFAKEERYDAAIEALQESIDIAPDAETYADLGAACAAKIDVVRTKRERRQLRLRALRACKHARDLDVALEYGDKIDATLAGLEERPKTAAGVEPSEA